MGGVVFAGEMQGTVHRLLLETRQNELKPGSVLLLKQVRELQMGTCSPASRPGESPWLSLWLPALPGPRQRVAALVQDPGSLEPSKGLTAILQGADGGGGCAVRGRGRGTRFYSGTRAVAGVISVTLVQRLARLRQAGLGGRPAAPSALSRRWTPSPPFSTPDRSVLSFTPKSLPQRDAQQPGPRL